MLNEKETLAAQGWKEGHVVNALVASGEWDVACFCFQNKMYCDIALRRISSSPEQAVVN